MKREKEIHKICVLGEEKVHKTALTIKFCSHPPWHEYDPTGEDSYRKEIIIDDKDCLLEILDTAGQEEFTSLRDQWIRDSCGFLLVFDLRNRSSFEKLPEFYEQILRVKGTREIPIVLVGISSEAVEERRVGENEAVELASKYRADYKEISLVDNQNVEESFIGTVRLIRNPQTFCNIKGVRRRKNNPPSNQDASSDFSENWSNSDHPSIHNQKRKQKLSFIYSVSSFIRNKIL